MTVTVKRIALFPGLDGTGHLLSPLKDSLLGFETDIISYADNFTSVADIVADIEKRYSLDSYTHFFCGIIWDISPVKITV